MQIQLPYDDRRTLDFDVRSDALVAGCFEPRGDVVTDVRAMADRVLADPLDFPPLRRAVVPGDRVAITLDDGIPQVEAVVASIVEELLEAEVEPGDIELVQTPVTAERNGPDPRSALRSSIAKQVRLSTHDPSTREKLGYVAASKANLPVYFNRALHDADMVVVVGCLRLDSSLGYHGIHGTLFPTFADEESQQRFRSPPTLTMSEQQNVHRAEAEEASWLLGAMFTVQVLPGSHDQVLDLVAGQMKAVTEHGGDTCRSAWQHNLPRRADLVVASISSSATAPNWDDFARALAVACDAVEDDGAIAICGSLSQPPGASLERLAAADHAEDELASLLDERPVDALVVNQLAVALQRAKVYLLSDLPESTVEKLGMAYVESAEELARLVDRHESCIFLADAHFAGVAVAD